MASNIQVNVTADATQLRTQLAMAQADLKAYGAEVRKTADQLRQASEETRGGLLQSLEQSAAKYNTAKAAVQQFGSALQEGSRGAREMTTAVQENTGALHNNGAASEAMVLVHEAMSGRFTRMGSSLMILTQRMYSGSMAAYALAGAFGVAAMSAMHLVEWLNKVSAAKLLAEAGALGSGLDPKLVQAQVDKLRSIGDVTSEEAGKVVHAFASMRGITQPVLDELTTDIRNLALRMGEDVPAASAKVYAAWNLNAKAGAELLDKTRASREAIDAFTHAAENNKGIEARRILLQELARNEREVQTQTRLSTTEISNQATMTARMQAAAAAAGRQGLSPAMQANVDTAKLQDADIRAQQLAKALAAVNGELAAPEPQSWSQRMTESLAEATLKATQAARAQGQNWQQVHERQLEVTVNFWKRELAATVDGTKNQREAQLHLLRAEEALENAKARLADRGAKQGYEATVARYDAEIQAARGNFAQVIALEQQKLDFIRKAKGEQSHEFQAATKSSDETLARSIAEQMREVEQSERRKLEVKRATLDEQVAMGQMTKVQELAQLQQAVEASKQLELKALDEMISLLAQGTNARNEALKVRKALEEKFQVDLAKLHAQEVREAEQNAARIARDYLSAFSSIESTGKRVIGQLITGQTTWAKASLAAMQAIMEGTVDLSLKIIGRWAATELAKLLITEQGARARAIAEINTGGFGALIATMLARWLGLEAEKTAETAAGAGARALIEEGADKATLITGAASRVAEVEGLAGVAGAAAFASTAAIPIVGPELAPGAAAAAVGAVQAFVPMASLAVGTMNVPRDMIARIHEGEIVMPRPFAEDFRAGRGSFGGGHTVNVAFTVQAVDAASFQSMARTHAATLARAIKDAIAMNPSLRPAH